LTSCATCSSNGGKITGEPGGVDYIETDAGGVPAMWAAPKSCMQDRVLLGAHGGGYVAGSMYTHRKEESTKVVAERMAKNAPTTVPQTPLPNVTYAVGGVAIMAGDNIIGGIGVSGAPGGQFDEEWARAALAKIADRMK
jgi:hypothetical protein